MYKPFNNVTFEINQTLRSKLLRIDDMLLNPAVNEIRFE